MGAIIQLNDELSNKIAAGEVVERPASVVKELIENAIDAGSTRIEIELEEGGLSFIRVKDNGCGMDKEDAELAFSRHATSKLKHERELFHLSTLGFRGEALPSIAAVSHLEMETGNGEDPGTLLRLQGGKQIACMSTKSRRGTDIKVRDLFFNTPARLKYMKTIHTELGKVTDIVNRQAMARPDISFKLVHGGRQLLFTNGQGRLKDIIASIYGRQTARKFVEVKQSTLDFQIEGFAAKPEINRASRQYVSIFVNGRYIRHFPLIKAVEAGYHTLLPIGRHPLTVLHLSMDPILLDVNVHPSKLDVRLSKETELLQSVEQAVKESLKKEQLIPEVERPKQQPSFKSEQLRFTLDSFSKQKEPPKIKEKNSERLYEQKTSFPQSGNGRQMVSSPEKEQDHQRTTQSIVNNDNTLSSGIDRSMESMVSVDDSFSEERKEVEHIEQQGYDSRVPALYPIGQLHGTYILAQNEKGLYIIDQHAAQERIFYEHFKKKIGDVDENVQDLLVPITLECSAAEAVMIEEHQSLLEKVGIFLEPFGPHTYRISSHPVWFPKGAEEETIREMLDQLFKERRIDIHRLREEAAILMSCKAAIKANRHLREDEMFSLLETLRETTDPFTCPHGRPIIIHYSSRDLEKMFKRIM